MADDSNEQARKDVLTLAEAALIRDDDKRREAVRRLTRENKDKKNKADLFAEKGSFAGGLRSRREAIESGDLDGAASAYRGGITE